MRTLFTLLVLFTLAGFANGQGRELAARHSNEILPATLSEYPDLQIAAGIAQSPSGYPVMLHMPIPSQSLVCIYAQNLKEDNVFWVLLTNQGNTHVVAGTVGKLGLFGIQTLTFRLPPGLAGETFIKAVWRSRETNTVRLFVDQW